MASPLPRDAKFARVDQGVDYQSKSPYLAVGAGQVIHISKGFVGGTGDGIYIKLDKPVTVNGRTYGEVYYAEQKPLVRLGEHVAEGQAVMSGGGAELGFASGGKPVAPLVGGLGKGTKPTQAGNDFLMFVKGGQDTPEVPQTTGVPPTQTDPTGLTSQLDSAIQQIPQPQGPDVSTPSLAGDAQDLSVAPQGGGQSTWQLIASQGNVSPDTIRLAELASYGANAPSG